MITETLQQEEAVYHRSSGGKESTEGALSATRSRLTPPEQEEALELVQRFFLLPGNKAPHVVVFAGVEHGNGCSQICAAVAESLAANSHGKVCLLEGNFRSPSLPSLLGMSSKEEGFSEALMREGSVTYFAKQLAYSNLWLMSKGNLQVTSPVSLGVENLQRRFVDLRTAFDFIVVDAPPMATYADALSLARWSDGVILVLEANTTRRETAQEAANSLRTAGVPVLGAVLNKNTQWIPTAFRKMF